MSARGRGTPCRTAPHPRRAGQRAVEGEGTWRRTASFLLHHHLTDSHTHSCTHFAEGATEAGKDHSEWRRGNHHQLRVSPGYSVPRMLIQNLCKSLHYYPNEEILWYIKRNEVWTPATTWMTPENIMLSERRARQLTRAFLPGESPRTEEPGGLQSVGSHRAGHNWSNLACMKEARPQKMTWVHRMSSF